MIKSILTPGKHFLSPTSYRKIAIRYDQSQAQLPNTYVSLCNVFGGMQNFFDWFQSLPQLSEKPWLILGKGPSYARYSQFDTNGFHKVSLNHVIREQPVDIAHIIDFDVAIDCAAEIDRNAKVLVMPWWPHVKNRAGSDDLPTSLGKHEILRRLRDEGRVKFYNLASGKRHGDTPMIPINFFSVEAVVNLLFLSGIRTMRTLGVDGGTSYSNSFKDLADKTLLNNGHQNFDIQFRSIAKKIMNQGLDYSPLDVPSPVRVYVGSMPEQDLATMVLEYSIKKNASLPVEVMPLYKGGITFPMPRDPKNKPRTPFSFQRFQIPELNGFKGRAIYVDSDMQVFVDIKDLWARDMKGADVLSAYESSGSSRRPQFSVMLLDCEKLKWNVTNVVEGLDRGDYSYEQLMYEMKVAKSVDPAIEHEWNSLERFEAGSTKLLHYTDMERQPWLFRVNPLIPVWVRELREAIEEGYISWGELRKQIAAGNVRPSLWYQATREVYDAGAIPAWVKAFDYFFVPPHRQTPGTSRLKLALNSFVGSSLTFLVPRKGSLKGFVKKLANA
jgi:hypothetical protein